jgi:hypothetical protein
MNKDLFLAILAMNSYNRGDHTSIQDGAFASGTNLGRATILNIDLPDSSRSAELAVEHF